MFTSSIKSFKTMEPIHEALAVMILSFVICTIEILFPTKDWFRSNMAEVRGSTYLAIIINLVVKKVLN